MLSEYLLAAKRHAVVEHWPEEGVYCGEIPVCPGVWATAASEEACRAELGEVLDDWVMVSIARHTSLPEVDVIQTRTPTPNAGGLITRVV